MVLAKRMETEYASKYFAFVNEKGFVADRRLGRSKMPSERGGAGRALSALWRKIQRERTITKTNK
jgi:hypothetical protein